MQAERPPQCQAIIVLSIVGISTLRGNNMENLGASLGRVFSAI